MTFEANEISSQDGKIISLYEFMWGETFWRYTSTDKEQTITQNGVNVTYQPIAIDDDGMVQGGSANNDLKVKSQNDIPLVDLFRGTPPAGSIWLTVRRRHADDPLDQWFVYWIGTIGNVKKAGLATAEILARTLLASFKRQGLRLAWTRGCPHILYDSECRANPVTFAVAATITVIANGVVTVDAAGGHPIGYFDGGYIRWQATVEGTFDRRAIESSPTATSFLIFGSTERLAVGMAVTLYPGCDLTATTCKNKFANLVNFGGFEQMSGENPFDGKNIF